MKWANSRGVDLTIVSFAFLLLLCFLSIQVSCDGEKYEEVARMNMEELTTTQACTPLRLACIVENVTHFRIQMMGYARYNDQGYFGLKSVVIHRVKTDPEYLDVREVLNQLQDWLVTVSDVTELNAIALTAMERVCCSSGLLSSVLNFLFCLLQRPHEGGGGAAAIPSSSSSSIQAAVIEESKVSVCDLDLLPSPPTFRASSFIPSFPLLYHCTV